MIDGVEGFGLQAYRLAGHQFQFAESGGFLVEQTFDHILVRQHHQLLALELPRLTHELTEYFITHCFRRFDEAPAFACWTRLAQ